MKELVFALEFKGSAEPVPGAEGRLKAKTAAASQTLRTAMKADGIQTGVESAGGPAAHFESEVEIIGEGAFLESGTIRYGEAGTVRFKTVGRGVIGESPNSGQQRGAVIWELTGGEGRFLGAQGLITSNFTVDGTGQVVDDQFARIFLP